MNTFIFNQEKYIDVTVKALLQKIFKKKHII